MCKGRRGRSIQCNAMQFSTHTQIHFLPLFLGERATDLQCNARTHEIQILPRRFTAFGSRVHTRVRRAEPLDLALVLVGWLPFAITPTRSSPRAMESTVTGDSYVTKLAAFVRANATALSGGSSGGGGTSATAGPSWLPSLGSTPPAPARRTHSSSPTIVPPKPLQISLHHLSYLLLRFDALGLPVGKLDEPLPPAVTNRGGRANRQSTFSFISAQDGNSSARPTSLALNPETASIGSVRSTLSRISVSAASATTSWFGFGSTAGGASKAPVDPDVELKRLYSTFTKLPALDIVPAADAGLIEGFDDQMTPTTLTPFDCFKNLQLLSITDVDPRTISGWDRLSCQLRSLTMNRGGLEDLEDLFVSTVAKEAADRSREPSGGSALSSSSSSTTPTPTPTQPALPSLAWHFLTHLGLPSSSLTFFADLPLFSLRSLDLSHNLLNSIPPSLAAIPSLQSLDLTGNLIEDCRGAGDILPSIRTLNLRGNRLEFLSGLERLTTLRQVDLRENEVYEASEVGRLAQLPMLQNIWIRSNPVYEEYPDPRVEILLEFAKDGWPLEGDASGTLTLDGEACGYFERKRVVERLPLGMKLAPPGSRRGGSGNGGGRGSVIGHTATATTSSRRQRDQTPLAQEPSMTATATATAEPDTTKIVSASSKRRSRQKGKQRERQKRSPSAHQAHGSERRRHRRIVHLDDDDNGGDEGGEVDSDGRAAAAATPRSSSPAAVEELTEAEKLKRDVMSGGNVSADGGDEKGAGSSSAAAAAPPTTSPPAEATTNHHAHVNGTIPKHKASTIGRSSGSSRSNNAIAAPHSPRAAATRRGDASTLAARRSKVTTSLYDPPMADLHTAAVNLQQVKIAGSTPGPSSSPASASNPGGAADLRARIEGLKREVGDDWLRVLSRGGGVEQ